MERALSAVVRARAHGLCEYCHSPQSRFPERFQIDHIIARQHGGASALENLALSCLECNRRKGPNISGIDPLTRQRANLYHPREDSWEEHFSWNGPHPVSRTAIGRTTIQLLDINRPERVAVRRALIDEGVFPLQ